MSDRLRVSVVGGRGYVGGELLRLLLFHPHVKLHQVTSGSGAGKFVHSDHPNLRGHTNLKYINTEFLEPCDVLILAQPHGVAANHIDEWAKIAPKIIDCSADFRLNDPAAYTRWYGEEHPAPEWLQRFSYGLPESFRELLATSNYASGVGCNATVTNLALKPLAQAGLLERVVADIKVGSSEGGAQFNAASHHPERSGTVRSYKLTGHRHQAEVEQLLGTDFKLHMSVTSVEMVRGVLVTAHCFVNKDLDDKAVWQLYRQAYSSEPFVRVIKQKTGIHRYPDPKILVGSNYCDVGFAVDAQPGSRRIVVIAAMDNLMKGAAGTALQTMNIMMGLDETAGLQFPGLHPV